MNHCYFYLYCMIDFFIFGKKTTLDHVPHPIIARRSETSPNLGVAERRRKRRGGSIRMQLDITVQRKRSGPDALDGEGHFGACGAAPAG